MPRRTLAFIGTLGLFLLAVGPQHALAFKCPTGPGGSCECKGAEDCISMKYSGMCKGVLDCKKDGSCKCEAKLTVDPGTDSSPPKVKLPMAPPATDIKQ